MQKPDWKVAVIGGSIAALGLGGFAAAQAGGPSPDSKVPDGIRLQRDASVSIHSLSSVVEVERSTTTTGGAGRDTVPQLAPALVDSWDSPASVRSLDSPASVQSLDSPASIRSVDSPDSTS